MQFFSKLYLYIHFVIFQALDLKVTLIKLCEFLTYMQDILHYPIPNNNCVDNDQLQQDIILVMEMCLNQLLEKCEISFMISERVLIRSINKYFECTLLITKNQIFMKDQYDKTLSFIKTLKLKVLQMQRNSKLESLVYIPI